MSERSIGAAIEARSLVADDLPAIRTLYARVWGRTRDERYDRMRFVETMDGLPMAATGWSDGMLAGFFTLWPLELTDGRRVVKAGEAMDVMTDDRHRGKGVFPQLADHATQMAAARGARLLFGAPNDAIFATYLKRLAWASPTFIRSYVRPLSLVGVVPAGGLASPGFALWPRRAAGGFTVREGRPDAVAIAACVASDRSGDRRWRIHRTAAWYDFRYRDAGRFDYRWVGLWRGEALAAFAIWGLSTDGTGRLRRSNLVELIGVDGAARQAVTGAVVRSAVAAGAHYLAATMTSRERAREFRANGFLPWSRSPLIVKTLGADAFDANPFTADGWDLFGADFDFV